MPTTVLQFVDIITLDELFVEADYNEITNDLELECRKIASVSSMYSPRASSKKEARRTPGVCQVFVQFATVEDAMSARSKLNGRKYAGSIVRVKYFDPERYSLRDFD